MIRQLPFLLTRVFNTPLMVTTEKLDTFMVALPGLFNRYDEGGGGDGGDDKPQRASGYTIKSGVATLPIHGVLVRRAGQMDTDSSPLQSYQQISNSLRAAISDSRVRAILLDTDTPGGEAGMVMDLARDIRAASQTKPVWAIANDEAMSAGYALASAADRVWTTRTGGVGSIGTLAMHTDQSQFDAAQGFKFNYIYAGAHKIDASRHAPLSPDARSRIQSEVDRMQDMFVGTVAQHRGMPPEQVRATEAGLYFGEDAIYAGLADQVGTFDEAHAALASRVAPSSKAAARTSAMSETTENMTEPATLPAQTTQQPTPPAQTTQEPMQQSAEVIRLAAVQQTRSDSVEIAELCALAGFPDKAAEIMRANLSIDQVRQRLLNMQAERPRADPIMPIDPSQVRQATGEHVTMGDAYGRIYGKGA
jgi:signal peptide peptidase SppA